MCEFTVILDDEIIAEKVIKAKMKDNVLIMLNTKGESLKVPDVIIKSLDTIMAELILQKL